MVNIASFTPNGRSMYSPLPGYYQGPVETLTKLITCRLFHLAQGYLFKALSRYALQVERAAELVNYKAPADMDERFRVLIQAIENY